MTTIRVRTTARKIALKVRPGVRVKTARSTVPGKTRRVRVKQPVRFQQDHD